MQKELSEVTESILSAIDKEDLSKLFSMQININCFCEG